MVNVIIYIYTNSIIRLYYNILKKHAYMDIRVDVEKKVILNL